jgi:hypothetical protein
MDDFKHEPLPDAKTHIRLLQITQGSWDQPVKCVVAAWPLDTVPTYTAISYTWGDPSETTDMELNGTRFLARRNCEYALQQAYSADPKTYYWIDAICINQQDDEEKSYQVTMMGALYKKAARVLACVGQHADDSAFLIDILESRKSFFSRLYHDVTAKNEARPWAMSMNSRGLITLRSRLFSYPGEIRARLLAIRGRLMVAILEFLRRPYFRRVWILQELFMGNGKVTVCCDTTCQPLSAFFALNFLTLEWIYAAKRNAVGIAYSILIHFPRQLGGLPNLLNMFYTRYIGAAGETEICLGIGAGCKLTQSGPSALLLLHKFQCEDPRDRIYGVRDLIKWPNGLEILPDYTKDHIELAESLLWLLHTEHPHKPLTWLSNDIRRLLSISRERLMSLETTKSHNNPLHAHKKTLIYFEARRVGEIKWWGVKLSSAFRTQRREEYTELCNSSGEVVYITSITIRSGDWLLANPGTSTIAGPEWIVSSQGETGCSLEIELETMDRDGLALILRASPGTDRFRIAGMAFPALEFPEFPNTITIRRPRCFVLWWHPKDLLAMDWRIQNYRKQMTKNEEIEACIRLGMPAKQKATFAQGPYDLEQIRTMCQQKDSATFLEPEPIGDFYKQQWEPDPMT